MTSAARPAVSEPRTLVLLGIPFHDVTGEEVLSRVDDLVARGGEAYFVTANLDFAAQASEDVELQRILVEADLVLCDGTPLIWISRLAGVPLRERVAGSDLVPRLAAHAQEKGYRIFLLGGETEALQAAAANLSRLYPGLPDVGIYSPPFASLLEIDNAGILDQIRAFRPHILLVAFGCPKQEKWIAMHYRGLGVACCIGVGATIDFLAGKFSRAPAWMARFGLEWVYRLSQEPGRLAGRYWRDARFLVRQAWKEIRIARRRTGSGTPGPVRGTSSKRPDAEVIVWRGPLGAAAIGECQRPSLAGPFLVDMRAVDFIDSSGLGFMLSITRKAWSLGIPGCFVGPTEAVRKVINRLHAGPRMGAEDFRGACPSGVGGHGPACVPGASVFGRNRAGGAFPPNPPANLSAWTAVSATGRMARARRIGHSAIGRCPAPHRKRVGGAARRSARRP
jgi:N-acetylglucosaminyldiphosphoundecaprenol N-acetyl-beta-D-mannosaminyltransferase